MDPINTNGITTTGFNEKTMDHLLLDAGAVYKNFGLPDQMILGATSGGNEFDAKAKIRQIQVDGVKAANAKGMEVIDSVTTTLKCTFIEISKEILAAALIANIDVDSDPNYDIITGKTVIEDSDYIQNIAWVGTLSGSNKPVIILIENALCLDGLSVKTADSKDNTLPVTFTAHADPTNPKALPYAIYYPKLTDVAFNLLSAAVSNGKVILTMSDDVAETIATDGFVVMVGSTANTVTAANRGIDLNTIELTVTNAISTGQTVTIAYTQPTDTTKQVQSADNVALATFTATNVINN